MRTLAQLRESRAEVEAKMQAIVDVAKEQNRELTAEEAKEVDDISLPGGVLAQLDEQIGRAERIEARQKEIARERGQHLKPENSEGEKRITVPARAIRGPLKAFAGPDAHRDAYISGQWAAATLFNNENAAEWCREHGVPVKAAMTTGENSKGGYTIPDPLESTIIRLVEEYGVVRRNMSVWPLNNGRLTVPRRTGGFTGYWVGENTAITESDMAFGHVELVAKKLGAATRISSELTEDSAVALADLLAVEMARVFAYNFDLAAFNGDGTSTYGGIVGLANALADGAIVTTASNVDTFAELTIATVEDAMGKLPMYPGIMPKFYMHKVAWHTAFQRLAFAAGGNSAMDFQNAMQPSFLGHPVEFVQVLPGTSGSTDHSGLIFAYFGDLSMAAAMGEARGVTIGSDQSKYWLEDSISVKGTMRADFKVHDIGDASNAGAIVALKFNAS